jgi:hypothetical protein
MLRRPTKDCLVGLNLALLAWGCGAGSASVGEEEGGSVTTTPGDTGLESSDAEESGAAESTGSSESSTTEESSESTGTNEVGSSTGEAIDCVSLPLDECGEYEECVVVWGADVSGSEPNLCVGDTLDFVACMPSDECEREETIACIGNGHEVLSHSCLPPGYVTCDEPVECLPPCLGECPNDGLLCCELEDCPAGQFCLTGCCIIP